jgi:hypothetical protein
MSLRPTILKVSFNLRSIIARRAWIGMQARLFRLGISSASVKTVHMCIDRSLNENAQNSVFNSFLLMFISCFLWKFRRMIHVRVVVN